MKKLVFAMLVVAQILNAELACSVDFKTAATKLATVELFPRIVAVSFHSASLNKRKRCVVVLPVDWQTIKPADRRSLVILHGRGRHELSLIDDKLIRPQLLDSGLFVILPDGDDGWYVNSPVRKPDVYATYLEEVLSVISQEFQLPAQREQWAIAGWSMGGFGCVDFAARHPDRFAAVSSIIGLLDFPRTGLPEGQSYKVPTERFGTDATIWEQFNPLHKAEKLAGMSVLIITADEAFDRTMNEHFRDRLIKLNQPHKYVELKGGHTFPVVREAIPHVLAFTKKKLRKSQGK